jgi:hypothetical protein
MAMRSYEHWWSQGTSKDGVELSANIPAHTLEASQEVLQRYGQDAKEILVGRQQTASWRQV